MGGAFGAAGGGLRSLRGGSGASASAPEGEAPPAEEQPAGGCAGGQSFTAGTLVLLASGKAVPISSLQVGDKVSAVNTKTGKPQAKKVAAVLVHWDTDLYNLTVESGGHTEVIHTTSSHLFWDPYLHQWVKASALKKGERLKTPDGSDATADGGSVPAVHDGWMWDLTIQDDHDFFVESAAVVPPTSQVAPTAVPVLVHNCNTGGTAAVRWDPDMEHATIRIDMPNGNSRETNQVILGENADGSFTGQPTTGQVVSKLGGLGPNAKEITFNLPDPQAAWEAQGGTLRADLGPYDGLTNSCVTYCVDILRAGGVDIPAGVRGMLRLRRMYEAGEGAS
jgi:hypothetical protein